MSAEAKYDGQDSLCRKGKLADSFIPNDERNKSSRLGLIRFFFVAKSFSTELYPLTAATGISCKVTTAKVVRSIEI